MSSLTKIAQDVPATERLKEILQLIVEQVIKKADLKLEHPIYTVPLWATYTMVGCIVLSLVAASVGHWVSSKSPSR